jgi:3-oxoacyl-[acyl-carrier protein] reductase
MDLGIRGRRALVGGASSGLGLAIAERLAAEGCSLAITSRRADVLGEAAADIARRHSVPVTGLEADFVDPGAAAALARRAVEALGGVDILILNAGGPPTVDVTATDAEGWQRALQLLVLTPIELATRLLPAMRAQGWGRIVAVGSYAARQPIEELAYSNAGRNALMAWLKTTSRVVAADGVTINGALPGRQATARIESLDRQTAERTGRTIEEVRAAHIASIPAGRYGQPDEFASYVAYLCGVPAAYQTGTFTIIDGGLVVGFP